jgi:hypothetical protein
MGVQRTGMVDKKSCLYTKHQLQGALVHCRGLLGPEFAVKESWKRRIVSQLEVQIGNSG